MDCLGRKVIIQFLSSYVLRLLHESGNKQAWNQTASGLRIRSRLLMKVSLGGLQRKS